jgi:hypothetical protein
MLAADRSEHRARHAHYFSVGPPVDAILARCFRGS